MAPRAKSRPEHLGRAINRTLRSIEHSYPDQAHHIWDVWDRAVGETLANRCRPLDFRNGTLVLAVSSAAWMQQVQFLVGTIRDAVNGALGEDLVQQVRLRVAETPPPAPKPPASLPPNAELPPLPAAQRQEMEQELAAIAEPRVREAVRRVRERSARLARLKAGREE